MGFLIHKIDLIQYAGGNFVDFKDAEGTAGQSIRGKKYGG